MQINRLFQIIYHLLENGKSSAPELPKNLKSLYGPFIGI